MVDVDQFNDNLNYQPDENFGYEKGDRFK